MSAHVLVTGGAGYIGSHTAKALAGAGFVPVVLDSLVNGHQWAVKWGPFVQADLADREQLRQVFQQYPIQAVIHFAAYAYVGESMHSPEKYFRNNFVNTLNLLDAMREAGVCSIVFSVCHLWRSTTDPIPEDHPQNPINPYGESKLMVERALRWYGSAYGLRAVILRYFNAAGADPDGEIGEDHNPETHLIPLAIMAALGTGPVLNVLGSDYDTADGTAVRDYVHVSDLASAHVSAARYLQAGGTTMALNLGTGQGATVREVISMVETVGGRPVPVALCGRRAGDPPVLVCEPTAAMKVLGWKPEHSDLRTFVDTAWRWHAQPI